jgi:hypothetical protein
MLHSMLAGEIVRQKMREVTLRATRAAEVMRSLEASDANGRPERPRQSGSSPSALASSLIELMTTSASGTSESSS